MAELTSSDVGQITEEMQRLYMPNREACGRATPQEIGVLLSKLAQITDEVRTAAKGEGIFNITEWWDKGPIDQNLLEDGNVQQFAVDMAQWQQRLAHYQRMIDSVPPSQRNTVEGCAFIWKYVTAPLLAGIWYEVLPGMNFSSDDKAKIQSGQGHDDGADGSGGWQVGKQPHPAGHSSRKPPDVIMPFTLGNQAKIYRTHQRERWQQLKADLKRNALNLVDPPDPIPWLKAALIIGGAVALTGGIYAWVTRRGGDDAAAKPKRAEKSSKGYITDEILKDDAEANPKLWRKDGPTWRYERDVSLDEADRWLEIYRRDAPGVEFRVAAKKPPVKRGTKVMRGPGSDY